MTAVLERCMTFLSASYRSGGGEDEEEEEEEVVGYVSVMQCTHCTQVIVHLLHASEAAAGRTETR